MLPVAVFPMKATFSPDLKAKNSVEFVGIKKLVVTEAVGVAPKAK
jgi:hypothetical protein